MGWHVSRWRVLSYLFYGLCTHHDISRQSHFVQFRNKRPILACRNIGGSLNISAMGTIGTIVIECADYSHRLRVRPEIN